MQRSRVSAINLLILRWGVTIVGYVNLLNMSYGDVNLLLMFGENQDLSYRYYLTQRMSFWRLCGRLEAESLRLIGSCLWPQLGDYGIKGIRSDLGDNANLLIDFVGIWRNM